MAKLKIEEIEKKIKEKKAKWKAKENHISKMDEKDQKKLLGLEQPPLQSETPTKEETLEFTEEVDWRSSNHVTSVKNQGSCGSCVSFGTVAVVESMISIETDQKVDLSEADLHFCSSHGPSCSGWWPSNAFDSVKLRGVCDESCFPYVATNPACNPCSDRDKRAFKIITINKTTTANNAKNYISTTGPMAAAMDVYSDFYSYNSGVYKNVTGTYQGGHCITIVGYSELEKCWICKNSWGTAWGDKGYFKIAYGDCRIDTYEKVGAKGVIFPNEPVPPAPPTNTLTVSPTTVNVAQLAGSTNFTVASNVNWTVTSDVSWCTVSTSTGTGNGVFVASFTTNTNTASRKATITIKGGDIIVYVVITQAKYVKPRGKPGGGKKSGNQGGKKSLKK